MIEFFSENPLIVVAIMVFVVCFIIGFFGDMYLRKNNKIGKLVDFKNDAVQTNVRDNTNVSKTVSNNSSSLNATNDGVKNNDATVSNNLNHPGLNTTVNNERKISNVSNGMVQDQINKLIDGMPSSSVSSQPINQNSNFFNGNAHGDDNINNMF